MYFVLFVLLTNYPYYRFSYYLVNVFQSTLIREDDKAKQSLQKLQNFVRGISKNGFDDVYNRIGHALEHILLAVTAQVSLLNGDITEEESRNVSLDKYRILNVLHQESS